MFFSFRPTTNAIMGLTFAKYVIQPFFPGCGMPDIGVTLIAAATICESKNYVLFFIVFALWKCGFCHLSELLF